MKKENRKVAFSQDLIVKCIAFAFLSYTLIQIFFNPDDWIIYQSPTFNPFQIIIATLRTHWLFFLLWNALIIIFALIFQRGFQKYTFNEKLLQNILNSAADGIILIDENGEIVDTNPATEKIFGFSESEMAGQNISLLMPEPQNIEHNSYIKNYMKTGKAKVIGIGRETLGKRKNGAIFPIDLTVSEVRFENRRLFTGIIREISKRKEAEKKLDVQFKRQTALSEFELAVNKSGEFREMLDYLVQAIKEHLPADGGACVMLWKDDKQSPQIYSINMGSKKKDETIKQILFSKKHLREAAVNRRPLIVSEINQDESPLHDLLLENDIHAYAEVPMYAEGKVIGVLYAFEKQKRKYTREDFEFLLALANRAAIFIEKFNLYEDLKSSNQLLQIQKGELQALLDSTGGAIALISPEMQFIILNQIFAELFGIDLKEIDTYQLNTFITQIKNIFKEPDAIISRIYDTLDKTVPNFSDSFFQIWPFERELGLFSRPVQTADGEYLGRLFVFRDVTQEREVDRLKSEFISMVSHELRTPLTSIHGSLGLINGGVTGVVSAQTKALVEIAYKNSERLIQLINEILDLEKFESENVGFDYEVIDLIPLVIQSIQLNSAYADQYGVKFKIVKSIPEAKVFADTDRVMQVITNLLSNAAKFSPRDGTVEISVTKQLQSIRCAITNYGPAISSEFRKNIFQRFAQGDSSAAREKGGSGLGLYISKEIIKKLDGKIGYRSKEKLGTTFYFTLPEWKGMPKEDNL